MKDRCSTVSRNEKDFILKALTEQNLRVDGRKPYDFRPVDIKFALDDSSATVRMGKTMAMAVVTAEMKEPYPDRPSEGAIQFQVEFSPMASLEFEPGRPGEAAIEVARVIERSLRDSRALDTESLVILSGIKVWHVRCAIHVLDHDGNLMDACSLAALSALTVYRRPDVTIGGATGKEITVHPVEVKEPVPLTIHHIPLAVTIALFEDGTTVAVDPTFKEEATMTGQLTCVLNKQEELCSLQKRGGVGIAPEMVDHCISVAAQKVADLTEQLEAALARHSMARVQARIRRHAAAPVAADVGGLPTGGRAAWRAAAISMRTAEQLAAPAAEAAPSESSSSEEDDAMGAAADVKLEEASDAGEEEGGGAGQLPPGGLLMPAVVRAAGLAGPVGSDAERKSPNKRKAKRKLRAPGAGQDADDAMGDDFADIAAVIAGAAAKAGRPEGLQAAIKPKGRKRK
eukprot:jgi/Tetstr1/443011/TSEL_031071.t1